MKITKIAAYQVDLPLHEGSYKWSGGKSVTVFDSTVVRVETDEGVTGYGEVCPLGTGLPAGLRPGVRTGLAEFGAASAGPRPDRDSPSSTAAWTRRCKGHPYVKSAIDMACWDILGQGGRPAGLHAAGRTLRRRLRALSRHFAGVARGDGRQGGRLSRRRLSPLPAQSGRRSRYRHRPHSRRRRAAASRATC